MNEEELNKIIGSKLKYVREKGQAFSEIDLDSVEDCIEEGFQKGKLEQKKEELMFLDDCFRVYRGEKYIQSDSISKLIERIKQLQKEIKVSGDSLTEFWDNPEDDRWDKEEEKQDE